MTSFLSVSLEEAPIGAQPKVMASNQEQIAL